MLNRIEFVFGEALTALSRNRLMALAAVTTVAVSLFLFGGMGYAYWRLSTYAAGIPGKFQIKVFLRDDVSQRDVQGLAARLRVIPGVATASWIPRDKAWDLWKKQHPTALTEGVDNPLPNAFKVILKDLSLSDSVVETIKAEPLVASENGVKYMRDEQNMVEWLLTIFRWTGVIAGGALFVIAGVLIYNAIRLTVLSRRLEIRIMQLVGASRATVYIPFLIEGMIQGVVGSIVASGLVIAGYHAVNYGIKQVDFKYEPAAFPYIAVLVMLAAAGALYGVFCSVLAIRAPLKYR